MPERSDDGHEWVGAAELSLPQAVVRQVHQRQTFRLRQDVKVAVVDIYCRNCRNFYIRCAGQPCSARGDREDRDHLSGGPVGDRRKPREPRGAASA